MAGIQHARIGDRARQQRRFRWRDKSAADFRKYVRAAASAP